MSSRPKTIKTNIDVESVDIPTMFEMPDNDYRDFVREEGLMFVDHHDILRSTAAAYPIATTREQLEILIEELQLIREKLRSRKET